MIHAVNKRSMHRRDAAGLSRIRALPHPHRPLSVFSWLVMSRRIGVCVTGTGTTGTVAGHADQDHETASDASTAICNQLKRKELLSVEHVE